MFELRNQNIISKNIKLSGQPILCQLFSFIPNRLMDQAVALQKRNHYYDMTTRKHLAFITVRGGHAMPFTPGFMQEPAFSGQQTSLHRCRQFATAQHLERCPISSATVRCSGNYTSCFTITIRFTCRILVFHCPSTRKLTLPG